MIPITVQRTIKVFPTAETKMPRHVGAYVEPHEERPIVACDPPRLRCAESSRSVPREKGHAGIASPFIAHDLAVVEHISHRIAVMYLGRIVEYADKETLFTTPLHPYTEALLAAVPVPSPRIKRRKHLLEGDVPSPVNPPPGCTFHTRCPCAEARCRVEIPVLREVGAGHQVACHLR